MKALKILFVVLAIVVILLGTIGEILDIFMKGNLASDIIAYICAGGMIVFPILFFIIRHDMKKQNAKAFALKDFEFYFLENQFGKSVYAYHRKTEFFAFCSLEGGTWEKCPFSNTDFYQDYPDFSDISLEEASSLVDLSGLEILFNEYLGTLAENHGEARFK